MRRGWRAACLVAMAVVGLWGCPEDDPTPTSNVAANTTTNTTTPPAMVDCAEVCGGLTMCQSAQQVCGGQLPGGFVAACEAACGEQPGEWSTLHQADCEAAGPVAVQRLGLAPGCGGVDCERPQTDFVPGADDSWAACISDDGEYHQVEMSISSIGRVQGFEEIADLLWRTEGVPGGEAFVSARDIYATGEGLDSRVQRREDEHYPAVTDEQGMTLQCRDEGVPQMSPDRCVGPARILPILNDAFQQGIAGAEPLVQAARIEAALLWFLYVSTHKEAITCTGKMKDCDSSYAYYTGGQPLDAAIGLAGYFREQAPWAHERVWEGILAVRCWRDLDSGEQAMDLELRDQAVEQLDRALLYGVSRVVADRLARVQGLEGARRQAAWSFAQILGGVLDRAATERDPAQAQQLREILEQDAPPEDGDLSTATELLRSLFPCP